MISFLLLIVANTANALKENKFAQVQNRDESLGENFDWVIEMHFDCYIGRI